MIARTARLQAPPSPATELAVALERVLCERAAAADPWARYPVVLTTEHVAEILGVTVNAVGESARRGAIPMQRKLGRWRIDQVAFRAWLASGGPGGAE